MTKSTHEFWDNRYQREGSVWGLDPSPTARALLGHAAPGGHILDVGFGYGRDMLFLMNQGYRVTGVDPSSDGRDMAADRFAAHKLQPEALIVNTFEQADLADAGFDAVFTHRMLHLLLDQTAVTGFSDTAKRVLKPGGHLCVGLRSMADLDASKMQDLGGGVYEYKARPGHRIRYWGHEDFKQTFGGEFDIIAISDSEEIESVGNPVPCHFTIMVARKL